MKLYNNIKQFAIPTDKQDLTTVGQLHNSLWEQVQEIPEHYELIIEGTKGVNGVLEIVETVTDTSSEISLTDVKAKLLNDDSHDYVVGDLVKLVPLVEATETEIYMRYEDFENRFESNKLLMTIHHALDVPVRARLKGILTGSYYGVGGYGENGYSLNIYDGDLIDISKIADIEYTDNNNLSIYVPKDALFEGTLNKTDDTHYIYISTDGTKSIEIELTTFDVVTLQFEDEDIDFAVVL